MVPSRPFFGGSHGWVRSSAWIWDFSSTDSTMAWAGALTYSPTTELMFGSGLGRADFLYLHVSHAIGAGLVLDHHLFPGRNKLAGALGTIPALAPGKRDHRAPSFLRASSLHALASKLGDADASRIWSSPEDWGDLGGALPEWIDEISDGLAYVAQSAVALLDIDNLVIDGAIPTSVRREIAKATRRRLARSLADRPEPFSVLEGTYGHLAPVIGGASIPLLVKFSNDKELLFKE